MYVVKCVPRKLNITKNYMISGKFMVSNFQTESEEISVTQRVAKSLYRRYNHEILHGLLFIKFVSDERITVLRFSNNDQNQR